MEKMIKFLIIIFILISSFILFSLQQNEEIIPIYTGSDVRYDDDFGYVEFSFVINESSILKLEGNLRRIFCRAPEGRSPLEVIKNYEKAIKDINGSILFISHNPKKIEINGQKFSDIFIINRKDRGLSTSHFTHSSFPQEVTEYLVSKLNIADRQIYYIIAAGPGAWAANESNRTFFEIITFEIKPMDLDMITSSIIEKQLKLFGKIAIYSIFFDTGKSIVKPESAETLKAISEYLNANKNIKVYIVGHTDNTGDFDFNMKLSKERADAVMEKLINEYGVNKDQMKSYGVGSLSPIASNSTEEGKAKNRRVEIVEQ